MKLGIFISTNRNLHHLTGIVGEAVARGHEVKVFVMDAGSKLLETDEFRRLCGLEGVESAFCDLNAKAAGVDTDKASQYASRGSQYNNALMMNDVDRVLSL